jgi:CDP-diglyceride synthetase
MVDEKPKIPTNKPGIKTTEFWVASLTPIFVPLIMALLNRFGFPIADETTISMIVAASISTPIAYIIGRIFNKKKQADIEISKSKTGEK